MGNKVKQLLDLFWKVVEELLLVIFVIMLLLAILQVFFRYVVSIPVPWTEEAARWLYIWQIFLGSALAMREGIHLKITFLQEKLSPKPAFVVEFALHLLSFLLIAGIFVGSIRMMGSVTAVRAGSFNIPQFYLYLTVPISFALMFLITLRDLVRQIRVFVGGADISETQ